MMWILSHFTMLFNYLILFLEELSTERGDVNQILNDVCNLKLKSG